MLEHACFCAIDPRRRSDYADLVARLLKPVGISIHLAFPLSTHSDGLPFAVSVVELLALFDSLGFTLLAREKTVESTPKRRGLEELFIFQKADGMLRAV